MTHDAKQLLGAYALGALDPREREQLEQHLETCDQCRAELAQYQQVTEGLLHAVKAQSPPQEVRERVFASIAGAARPRPSRGEEPRPSGEALAGERPGGWRQRLGMPQAALAALGLVLVAVNLYVLSQVSMLSERSERLLAQQRTNQTALAVLSYPNSRVANLEQGSLRGSFIYDDQLPLAVLNVWGLPPLTAEQAYQLWLIQEDGSRESGGLLTPGEESQFESLVVWSPVSLAEIVAIGITIEPAGGSSSPSGPRVLGTDLAHSP